MRREIDLHEFLSFAKSYLSEAFPNPQRISCPTDWELIRMSEHPKVNAWVERVRRAGIQVNCHANGDVAIDMVLTALERAQRLFPRADARPRITHCTLVNDDLVRRIKAAGVVPAAFTSYAYYNVVCSGGDVEYQCCCCWWCQDPSWHPGWN